MAAIAENKGIWVAKGRFTTISKQGRPAKCVIFEEEVHQSQDSESVKLGVKENDGEGSASLTL